MRNRRRTFVDAVTRYCTGHGIAVESRSEGWLIIMQRGPERHFAFGYDLGLNSAVAHQIAKDKAATAEVLQLCGVACVPHTLFLNPEMNEYVPPARVVGSDAAAAEGKSRRHRRQTQRGDQR